MFCRTPEIIELRVTVGKRKGKDNWFKINDKARENML